MYQSIRIELLLLCLIVIAGSAKGNEISDCAKSENPIACRGVTFISKAFNQVVSNHDDTLKIIPGLEIVQNENVNKVNNANDERSMPEQNNNTFLSRLAKYLQTHDLKVKFADIVGKTDLQEVVNGALKTNDSIEEARKGKDKGGGGAGMLLASGLMMGKLLAALGLAAVGALALKALGVSLAALLLAGLIALKKLTEGGGDGGHQVHYATIPVSAGGEHHRKRRDVEYENERSIGYGYVAPLPYRAYDMNS